MNKIRKCYKKVDEIMNNFFYWGFYILGMFLILFIIGIMFVVSFQTSKYLVVIPIIIIIVSGRFLITYIKGICKLNSKDFPVFPEI